MTIHPVFALLLLGHILGEFYLQSDKMAEGKMSKEKTKSRKYLAMHYVLYLLCITIILFVGIEYSLKILWLCLFVSVTHLIVDFIVNFIVNRVTDKLRKYWKIFTLEQLVHLVLLGVAWWIWGESLTVRGLVTCEAGFLPDHPVLAIILCLLLIIRPVGALIQSGDIWDFSKKNDDAQKGAGKMIGYLERIIIFFLLLHGQYVAISFVMTAKSIVRFPEISADTTSAQAEYYLIGTLISMTSVFIVTLLVGLSKT